MGCGTSKSKKDVSEPQKKEEFQVDYFNNPEEKNQFIKYMIEEQEQLDEQREKSRRQTKILNQEKRQSSILKSQKYEVPNNQFSEWKYLNPESLEQSEELEQQNDETFSQFQQVKQLESIRPNPNYHSLKDNNQDQQYGYPGVSISKGNKRKNEIQESFKVLAENNNPNNNNISDINQINSNFKYSYQSSQQQVSQPLSDQPRIPANPRNNQIKRTSNIIVDNSAVTPQYSSSSFSSSSVNTPSDSYNSITEKNQILSNHNNTTLPRNCPKLDLDQLPHYVKSQPTMPWEDHCSLLTEKNPITRLKSSSYCQQYDENRFPDISQKCSKKSLNINNSSLDSSLSYCETFNIVFQSDFKVKQCKNNCLFELDKSINQFDLDSNQAENLQILNKLLLSSYNEYIFKLIAVIYSGFILKTKSFVQDNTSTECKDKDKDNSRSLKVLFFSVNKQESAQLDELMQKEVYLMERIHGKPGVITMKDYSFERVSIKTKTIGILIISLEDEVIGTMRDYRSFIHEKKKNLSMQSDGFVHETGGNSIQNGIQNNMNGSSNRIVSYFSERRILKKAKELIQGLETVFNARCYNYCLDESVILICSNTENIQLCDFGAQEFSRSGNYIFNEMNQNLVLQSPQIREILQNQPQQVDDDLYESLVSQSNQIYAAGVSLCLLTGIHEDSLIEYTESTQSSINELSQQGQPLNYKNSVCTHQSYSVRILAYRSSLRQSLFMNSLPSQPTSLNKSHLIINQLLTQSLNLSSFPLLESSENDVNYMLLCFMNIDQEERNIQQLSDTIEVLSSKYFIDFPILRLEHEYIKPPAQSRAPDAITFEDLKSRTNEQNPDTHYLLALGYNHFEKNYKFALGHVLKALELSQGPEYGEYLNSLGCILLNLGKIEQAQIAFDLAIQKSPRYSLPYYNSGFIKHKIERRPLEAMELYKQSLQLDEKLGETIFNIALLMKNELLQIDKARDKYQFYGQLFPTDSQVDNNIGVLEVEDSLRQLSNSTFPKKSDSQNFKKDTRIKLDNEDYFRNALRKGRKDVVALANLVIKEENKAQDLKTLMQIDFDQFGYGNLVLGETELNKSHPDIDAAETHFQNAFRIQPNLSLTSYKLGLIQFEIHQNILDSIRHYKKEILCDQTNFLPYFSLAVSYEKLLQSSETTLQAYRLKHLILANYRAAIILNPNSHESINNLAIQIKKMGQDEGIFKGNTSRQFVSLVQALLKAALDLLPDSKLIHENMEKFYSEINQENLVRHHAILGTLAGQE